MQPQFVRSLLAAGALLCVFFVVYASLVPLNYVPKPFSETVTQFQRTPWLRLGIENRADWVANGLIMLPAGFLAAGAIDWRRKRRWPLIVATPCIISILVTTVFAIEFVQIWFPPRTISQNDIFAGVLGSVGGVLLWWLSGKILIGQCEQLLFSPPGLTKWKLLMNFVVLSLLVYNLMPLDVLVSLSELRDKWNAGNIRVIPFQDFELGGKAVLLLVIASLRPAPFAFLATLQIGFRNAVMQGLALVVLLEAVKVPIFSRSATVTNLVVGSVCVVVVALSASMILRMLVILDRGVVWFLGAMGWSGVMLVGFLGRFGSIERDPVVIEEIS